MTWEVHDHRRDKVHQVESKSAAEEKKNTAVSLGVDPGKIEIIPPDSGGAKTDGGSAEVVETPEVVESTQPTDELPDTGPSITEDPLSWMPSEFTKRVDGTVTITRKGYEVLAHHYDIRGGTEMVVSPVDTDMDYAVHKATVTDADGDEYTAYGEAHADDNGVENIVRMSDTRAYKRAVSRATGVGTIAIEEIQNEL
jgi:hypothetical protein